jgi:diaminohydroxyphosphoribosylaminopyrimidine deaminase / 5-amino-6-(5-phosphoribosylamino)uracil reductase
MRLTDSRYCRLALRMAKQGEGLIENHPLESVLWMQAKKPIAAWHFAGSTSLDQAVHHFPNDLGGELVVLATPTEVLIAWINAHAIDRVIIAEESSTLHPLWKGIHAKLVTNSLTAEYNELNAIWLHSKASLTPYVSLSFGMSLDGKIATRTGDSKYISGPQSRQFVHRLRNRHRAILVGINTIEIDHPSLTTRLTNKTGRNPHRIVLDSTLKIALDEPILARRDESLTILITRKDSSEVKKQQLRERGAVIIEITDPSAPLNLQEALLKVRELGIDSILVEGGSTVHFSFLKHRLFQRLYATISPLIIGGDAAKSAVGGEGFATLKEAQHLDFVKIHQAGRDFIFEAIPFPASK